MYCARAHIYPIIVEQINGVQKKKFKKNYNIVHENGRGILTRIIEYYETDIAHGYFSHSLHNRFNVYVAALCKNYDRKHKQ